MACICYVKKYIAIFDRSMLRKNTGAFLLITETVQIQL